jgi:hypothetical protein
MICDAENADKTKNGYGQRLTVVCSSAHRTPKKNTNNECANPMPSPCFENLQQRKEQRKKKEKKKVVTPALRSYAQNHTTKKKIK